MKKIILFIFTLVNYLNQIRSQVLGIDFGDEFMKISLISPGKNFVIIENTTSNRKTHSSVSFENGERFYENEANIKRSKQPHNTFVFMKKFLGALASDERVFEIAKQNYQNYLFKIDPSRQTFAFELKNFSKEETVILSVEEIVAMILRRAKKLAEKQQGNKIINDCVITIPSNWNLNQMRALVDAAKIAALNPLGLINENSAAAIFYAIDRKVSKRQRVLFYNIGSSKVQVTLAEYYNFIPPKNKKPIESIKILADAVSEEISGVKLDQILANLMAKQFDQLKKRQGKQSILESANAMTKLLRECQKLKEVLSANKQSQFYVENLFDLIDFSSSISRADFEAQSEHLLQYITKPIQEVLTISGLELSQINSFEIIGGGVRVPMIQNEIQKYLNGMEISQHLNGDESIALGASFFAANLTSKFRVKQMHFYDGFNFEVILKVYGVHQNYTDEQLIFPYKQRYGSKKVFNISIDDDIIMKFFQRDLNGQESLIVTYTTLNISSINENFKNSQTPSLFFQFQLTSLNPVEIIMSNVKFETIRQIKAENTGIQDEDNQNDDEQENQQDKKIVNKTKKYSLDIEYVSEREGIRSLNLDELQQGKKKLKAFEENEALLVKKQISKNNIENLIFKVQNNRENEIFVQHSSPQELQTLSEMSEELDDWLNSEEARQSNYTILDQKFDEFNQKFIKIQRRIDESEKRPEAINALKKTLQNIQQRTDKIQETMYWITEQDKEEINTYIKRTWEWIKKNEKLQEQQPLYEEPVILVGALDKKSSHIRDLFKQLRDIKKPKETKETLKNDDKNVQQDL